MITFRAHCARGHDRVDYTDPAAFEAHMTGEHGAKKRRMGGHPYPAESGPVAPGWGPNGPLPAHPHRAPRAPKDTAKLTETLVKWQDEPWPVSRRFWGNTGPRNVIGADWSTDESQPRTWATA